MMGSGVRRRIGHALSPSTMDVVRPDDLLDRLAQDGAALAPEVLAPPVLSALVNCLSGLPTGQAGVRLTGIPGLETFLRAPGPVGALAAAAIGFGARAVRAVLFDKTANANWKPGWHQDRTIVVASRSDVDGFGPWSRKAGLQHVAPPFHLLERMITVRVHLDPVGHDNAPLLIAPGSHRLGRIPVDEIDQAVARCGTRVCLARPGDVWVYSTPIVHASEAAMAPRRRRVLQVDYATFELPGGLQWLGV